MATLAEDYAFGRDGIASFEAALEGTGASIVTQEFVPLGTTDYTASAERMFAALKDQPGRKVMHLAGGVLAGRITHLVLNDIGPEIPAPALERIIKYVGEPPVFPTIPEFEKRLREVYKPFGPNSEEYWLRMTDTSARRLSDGMVTAHYDPKVVWQFADNENELPIWNAYINIRAKTWLTRGVTSDILPLSVAKEMRGRGPEPEFYEFDDCGHAPTFTTKGAIKLLDGFWRS